MRKIAPTFDDERLTPRRHPTAVASSVLTPALRVLLVEDVENDAKLIMHEIRKTWQHVEFERVQDRAALQAALDTKTWDAIISDWTMPRFSGLRALDVVKAKGIDLPFIIVSGSVGEQVAVEAMRAGAHDYVLKDKLTRLAAVLEREIRECKLRDAHRKNTAALIASELRLSQLTDCGLLGIIVGDPSGTIIEANDTFLNMVDFSRDDLANGKLRWPALSPPEFLSTSESGTRQSPIISASTPYKKEFLRKDGGRVTGLVGGMMIPDESRSVGFVVDLTAQTSVEHALERSEEQLRQAQKMEAVGRLAGGVAHDFNNALSVILCYANFVEKALLATDPIREDVDQIRKAAVRAAGLTRQLLTFSRQEVVEARVIDLNAMLNETSNMLQRILGEDVNLVLLLAPALGRIRVNPSHIEQVIMNLVVNARDAMPTGGKLTIETQNVVLTSEHAREHLGVTPGAYVMLAVTDTGTGMDEATQAHIFEPFFTTKEVGKGTGLGLSTVFGIVRQCEGSIWVKSKVGAGATFQVYIPLVEAPADVEVDTVPPDTLRGTETILLVEDEDQIRVVGCVILRRQGYKVIEARNGDEALAFCESYKDEIDLLLTDVVMPGVSGPELAKRLITARAGIKVLFMSGYTDDALIRHGAFQTGIAYMQKPITPDDLIRKVRTVLDGGLNTTSIVPTTTTKT